MNEYLEMWKRYGDFSGRSSVRDYWMAYLFNVLAGVLLSILAYIAPALAFLGGLYSLVGLVPGLALTVRRLRDGGNGWGWIFITLVPLVGAIILIVKLCKASVPYESKTSYESFDM